MSTRYAGVSTWATTNSISTWRGSTSSSEELVTPGDGWNHELKKSDEIIPPLAEYLHAINQSPELIPYNPPQGIRNGSSWA